MSDVVIEHGESRRTRRLRQHRVRVALALAAVEGILVLAGALPWWLVVVLAAGALTLYVAVRERRGELVQIAWIAAFSQLVLLLVPIAAAVFTALAVALLVALALAALVALLRDRR